MTNRRAHTAIALAVALFLVIGIILLSFASTTWAAPGAQGTVPTRERPTRPPPTSAPPPDNGGDNGGNGGNQDNSGNNGGDNGGKQGNAVQTPPPAASVAVCAIGDAGTECAAPDVVVLVASGAAAAGSALTIEGPFGQPPCPPSPAGVNFLNRCYRFSWIGTDVQPLSEIKAPVQYCLSYGAEQLAAVNNKPEDLLIGWAGADGSWTLVKPTLDAAANRTCATSNQIATWSALFASQSPSNLLPTVGGQTNPLWLVPVGMLGAILMLGAWRLTRKAA